MLEIITPATSKRLTTLVAIKAELSITGSTDDAYLTGLLDQVSDTIATWCQRDFASETLRETLHQTRAADCLVLSRWPVAAVSSVSIADDALDPAEREVDGPGLLYRLDSAGNRRHWPVGRVVVEYTAGYVLPGEEGRTLPHDLERAALSLIKSLWFARDRDPLVRSDSVEGIGTTTYQTGGFRTGAGLPPDVEGLLARYAPVGVA